MDNEKSFLKNIANGLKRRLKKTLTPKENDSGLNFWKEKYLKHLPGNQIHTYELFRKKTYFRSGPDFLAPLREIFIDGDYHQILTENAFVIDCGAHIGLSVILIKHICPSAVVVCFEPDKLNFQLLEKNITSHGLTDVTAINKAVWTENKELSFDSEGTMSSRIVDPVSETGNFKVSACRLYDYLDREVDFLKIDIEGAEYEVVKDIAPRLKNVKRLFVEYHGLFNQNDQLLEILRIVRSNGFHFYIKEAGPVYPQPFTKIRGNSIYDLQLNIFCIRD